VQHTLPLLYHIFVVQKEDPL